MRKFVMHLSAMMLSAVCAAPNDIIDTSRSASVTTINTI